MAKTEKKENILKNIQQEAKEYYKGKNMVVRYIILGFLVILLVLQFIIPRNKDKSQKMKNNETSEISNEYYSDSFEFLGETIDRQSMTVISQIKFDLAMSDIQKLFDTQKYSIFYLYQPGVEEILSEYDVPTDFAFLLLYNVDLPHWILPESTRLSLGLQIDDKVDEVFNLTKSTHTIAKYFAELYDKYGDWNLVLMAYSIGEYELDELIDTQGTSNFDELYFYNMDDYYMVMGYSYIFQNLDDYIYTTDIENYDLNLTTMKVGEQKNLRKWCDKNGYDYNQIRQLNPRILGNSLPKGKREVVINN